MNDFTKYYDNDEVLSMQRVFIQKVFLWMSIALMFTGVVALYTVNSPWLLNTIFGSRIGFYLIIGLEFFAVWKLTRSIHKMTATQATLGLIVYSILNGLTLSTIFLVYTYSSVASVLFITAGMFGSMFMIGLTTKMDLSKMGSILMMGLIGIILASIVNMFLHASGLTMIISYIGVALFCALTMYDAQKLKALSFSGMHGEDMMQKMAVTGALMLYLDFINLFLFLIRIMGRRD